MSNWTIPYDDNHIPLSVILPWDRAYPSYYWGWYLAVIICYLGVVLNSFVIYIFLTPENSKILESKEARVLIFTLAFVDILQGLWHGTVSLGSLIKGSLVGNHETFCSIDTIITGSLLVMSLGIMDMMALHLFTRLTNPNKKKLPLVFMYIGLILLSLAASLIIVLVPGGSIIGPSGLICILQFNEPTTYLFFALVMSMMGFVVPMYVGIFSYYSKITRDNKDETISKRKKRLLFRFSLIIFVSFGTFGPYGITLVYGWATSLYPPGYFEMFGVLLIYLTTVTNPILYFYANPSALKVLRYKFNLTSRFSTTNFPVTASSKGPETSNP
eukprot:TRINITY_DN4520_c0_g1_i1.p1 TRINITY_DN4520_c0_g1~~TRINITY_DN4520_c0_g1_i1.p1  ORF type:complete len:328 (-),score=49.31 TRINITY_DN4520_c0_g1_i1:43-1026(-)